ncbi:serine hydrolase [Bosea sp. 117]|uniref:serine hydrolase domain-containing protein n=1 Tax=Bosea sp. 117 TaxID=1125973 RepID=UPI000493B765|nr:serine hydrolase [Bosea sp. 117]
MHRRSLLAAPLLLLTPRLAFPQGAAAETPSATAPPAGAPDDAQAQAAPADALAPILDRAASLPSLHAVRVAHDGRTIAARGYHGHAADGAGNIKSASKSVISALIGIAIEKGVLEGPDQKIAPLLEADLPADPDPRLKEITIGNLLSMQAGLGRTSGPNYGRWISSRNWVRAALAEPFDDEPGGAMLYSTGSTHLLSAILTRQAKRPTLALARDWLGGVEGFSIASWARDPQGIYFGGNDMAMRPSSLVAFGELYRNRGRAPDGRQVIPARWIAESWQPRTRSRFTGDDYGYGWFGRDIAGSPAHYGWGYGGQMIYVIPERALTIAMLSATDQPAGRSGYRDELHALAAGIAAALG